MKFIHSRKRYMAFLLSLTMVFTIIPFANKESIKVKADTISELNSINQNPDYKLSVSKTNDGKMTISNDAPTGGFGGAGTTNTSYLLTPSKIAGDFSVEATLKVISRKIDSGSAGVVGIGAFSGTNSTDAIVTAVARSDKGARSFYKKDVGTFNGGSPNLLTPASTVNTSIYLKMERNNGTYTATIYNGTANTDGTSSKALSTLSSDSANDMFLGLVVCGTVAEVSTFVIKQGSTTLYELKASSTPTLPIPTLTATPSGSDVNLSWTTIADATSYSAEYQNTTGSSITWNPIQPTPTTTGLSITAKNLTSATSYNFRVKVTGGASDGLYSNVVTATPVAPISWAAVASPVITGTTLSTDGSQIKVDFNMSMGAAGATKVAVEMSNNGTVVDTKSVTALITAASTTGSSVTFSPTASGTYTFTATASREGETAVKVSTPSSITFNLQLASPVIITTAVATGSIKVAWDAVNEAQSYKVEYAKDGTSSYTTAIASTTDRAYTISNLVVGTIYNFKVTAIKGAISSSAIVQAKAQEVTGQVVEWKSIIFGASTSAANNSISVDNVNNAVTVSAGSKDGSTAGGKLTGSQDGISYYYTEIDPSKNFDISADIKVNFFAKATPDNQEGFGIMARDGIGTNSNTGVFQSNMAMVGGYRGLVQSVFRNGVTSQTSTGALMEGVTKFGDRPANDGTATYKMTMKKTNTGYQVNVDNGTEKIYYRPKQLEVIDSGKIYVGFFAARVASITVSNIAIKTSDVATDPVGLPEPPTAVAPSINMTSLSGSSTASYDLSLLANIKGSVVINKAGTEIFKGPIVANTALVNNTTLVSGDNTFDVVYTPDPTESITSPNPITTKYVVTYKNYGTVGGSIYVSPSGVSTATGTENDPVDIYSATKFVSAGQTIYARGGTYNLTTPLTIEKGNDGTSDKLKTLSAYPNETPVFNFGTTSSGFILAANYWKVYGLEVTKANLTGFRISGNYNVVERMNTYENGDTGFQISGSSTDTSDKWPTYNTVLNCVSHDNMDVAQNNADGFAAKLTCGVGNIFRGCISHNNCDDGWDLYSKLETGAIGAVTVENCIAYGNGTLSNGTKTSGDGNGFKLGGEGLPVKHFLRNSLSFNNNATGITTNSDPAIIVENCTSVDNGKANYDFHYYSTATPTFTADNNISFRNASGAADDSITTLIKDTNYFYNGTVSQNASGKQVSASDFKSVTKPASVSINADGTFDIGDFMVLAPTSTIQGGVKFDTSQKDFIINSTFNMSKLQPNTFLDAQTSITNNKTSTESVLVTVALYDGNEKMVDMSCVAHDIVAGDNCKLGGGFTLPSDITNYKVRVFVWEGTNLITSSMQPLSNVITLQ